MKQILQISIMLLIITSLTGQVSQGRILSFGRITSGYLDNGAIMLDGYENGMLAILADSSLYHFMPGYGFEDVPAGNDFHHIAIGMFSYNSYSALAIHSGGIMAGWGDNSYGQLNFPEGYYQYADISGTNGIGVRVDGSLVAWGNPNSGLLNVPAGNDFSKVFCGPGYAVAVRTDGTTVAWGQENPFGYHANVRKVQIDYDMFFVLRHDGVLLQYVSDPPYGGSLEIIPGSFLDFDYCDGLLVAVQTDGSLASWPDIELPQGNNYASIATGEVTMALTNEGKVEAIQNHSYYSSYYHITGSNYIQISSSHLSGILGLKADGSLGGLIVSSSLTEDLDQLPAGNDYTAVSLGYYHALALRGNGSITAWGRNYYGECNFPPYNDYIAVSAGHSHSLALREGGFIISRGSTEYGLGNVPPGSGFVKIAAGSNRSMALHSDGSLVAWGSNYYGVNDVPPGNDFVDIACGRNMSLALRSDGSVAVWGQNYPDPPGNDYVKIAGGFYHYTCLRSDGTLYSFNGNAQYGDCDSPSGTDAWIDLTAGYVFTAGIREIVPTPTDDDSTIIKPLMITSYPNPARLNGLINFKTDLRPADNGIIAIYNLKGQKIKQISVSSRTNLTVWNGRNEKGKLCASGIYIYRLTTSRGSVSKKLILLK